MGRSLTRTIFSIFEYLYVLLCQLLLNLSTILSTSFIPIIILIGLYFALNLICNSLDVIASFLQTVINNYISIYDTTVEAHNSVSLFIPVAFTIWNNICRGLSSLITNLGTQFCTVWPPTDPVAQCAALSGIGTFFSNLVNIIIQLSNTLGTIWNALLASLTSIICDPIIAGLIGFTVPTECSSPPITLFNLLEWLLAFITYFIGLLPSILAGLKSFIVAFTGETGLGPIAALTPPHCIPTALPDTTGFIAVLFRILNIPDILFNIIVGLFLNVIVTYVDKVLCIISPLNIIPCLVQLFCIPLLSSITVTIPIIGSVTLDLSFICTILPPLASCPCAVCANPLGELVPCVISSTCAFCDPANTIFDDIDTILVGLFGMGIENQAPFGPTTC